MIKKTIYLLRHAESTRFKPTIKEIPGESQFAYIDRYLQMLNKFKEYDVYWPRGRVFKFKTLEEFDKWKEENRILVKRVHERKKHSFQVVRSR